MSFKLFEFRVFVTTFFLYVTNVGKTPTVVIKLHQFKGCNDKVIRKKQYVSQVKENGTQIQVFRIPILLPVLFSVLQYRYL